MDVSSINSDLIRGNVTTIILKALLSEDRYGYDILREIEVKSGGQYKLKQPTLYSSLKRLEKQGLINSYWGDESDTEGGRRRYYALTEAGRNYLDKMQSEYEYSRTILDSLLSEDKFDFENKEAPFDINSLRPYTKRGDDDEKIIENKDDVKQSIASDINVNNNLSENKQMFAPLDKGTGSYDTEYRHTSTSFADMIGKIDNILNKKDDETPKTTTISTENNVENIEKTKIEEKSPVVTENKENVSAIKDARDFLFGKNETKTELSSEEKQRRENAKKLLYGDNNVLNDENLESPVDNIKDNEILEEPKNIDVNNVMSSHELLFGKKTENVESNQTTIEDSRENSAKLIFDKYNKSNIEDVAPSDNLENNNIESVEKTYKPEDIFDKYKIKEQAPEEKEVPKVNIEPSPVPPAAYFSFRRDKDANVNYKDAFSDLRSTSNINDNRHEFVENAQSSTADLKSKLFTEGYKLRTYSRENTENYYSLNYIRKNRINRDCYAIMYALICLEVLIGWGIFKDRFTPMAYAAVCIIALIVPIIPFVIWTTNPDKRVHANYSFKTSILNRFMLYLNLLVIVILVGFFGLNANINDSASMIAPILVPALLLLNIPLSTVIYTILYKTKKYHIS